MKILYIVSGINSLGGIESFCSNIIPLIENSEFHIDILVTQNEPIGDMDKLYTDLGCKIYRIDSAGNTFARVKKKKEFFKSLTKEYDVVHIHTVLTTAYYFAKLSKKYTRAKVIVHSHTASNYEGAKLKNNLCRALLNKYSDYRIACSKNAALFLFGNKHGKTATIVYNPVNVDAFKFNAEDRRDKRKVLGLSQDDFVFLHVGRLTPAKNHKFLLQVFSEVHKRIPNSKLLLCGEGELRSNIENQVKELQLDKCVTLLGNRRDVNEIMSASDCFLFPSLYEGLGTVLVEAQVSGLPIIYSNRIPCEVMIDIKAYRLSIDCRQTWIKVIQNLNLNNRCLTDNSIINELANKFKDKNIAAQLKAVYNNVSNDNSK